MASNRKSGPQIIAPQGPLASPISMDSILSKRRQESLGKGYAAVGKTVRKFVDENLLKTRQHRGGVK